MWNHFGTMLLRTGKNLSRLLLTLAVASLPNLAQAQTYDFEHNQPQILILDGPVRFHLGDDADGKQGWALSTFDDSKWPLLSANRTWGEQGYRGYSGFAWYRFKVILPPQPLRLGILIPRLRTSYEIFANGAFVGRFGGMPPQGRYVIGFDQIFPLSTGGSPARQTISIAIRVWNMDWLARLGGGLEGAPVVGDINALKKLKTEHNWSTFWSLTSGNALMLMNLVAAFVGFFLFGMRPADREYIWFALYELLTGAQHLLADWEMYYPTSWKASWLLDDCLATSSWIFFLLFVFRILNGRRNWLFWAAVATAVVTAGGTLASFAEWISWEHWRVGALFWLIPYFSCILWLLFRRARQGVADAQLMLIPVALCYVTWFLTVLLGVLNAYGNTWVMRDFGWFFLLSRWPFPFTCLNVADMLMLLAVLAVLPLRFARSRRDEERLSREMESARTVQQVLIPTEIPTIDGFDIRCIYKPAGHVGGDFFQIIPIASGGLLIAIGDVSGKGMPAAMTVSLLVGTLRTLTHYTSSPAEILRAMNQRMLARNQGGFTTCLVLQAGPDYKLTIANAGHIAPYLQGSEVHVSNGFPLGLVGDNTYSETTLELPENAQLTLLTDGIVEARSRAGELLGFDRAAALSKQSAESIVEAAQQFGQEDDITVLTIKQSTRHP